MKRSTMIDTLDLCIQKLQDILLWESKYSDAGILIDHSMMQLNRAARILSHEERQALQEELSGHTREVERQIQRGRKRR